MSILTIEELAAVGVRFDGDRLFVELSDGREIGVPFARWPSLAWLARATPEQRGRWRIEPGGWAVYWDELDDGLEVEHLLMPRPIA